MPKRLTIPMREMLALQPRFALTRGKRAIKFLDRRRFRAAYDLMLLQSEVGLVDKDIAQFWTEVQGQSAVQRAQSFQLTTPPEGNRKRRRRRRRRGASSES